MKESMKVTKDWPFTGVESTESDTNLLRVAECAPSRRLRSSALASLVNVL